MNALVGVLLLATAEPSSAEARAQAIDGRRELLAPGWTESGCHEGGALRGFKDGDAVVKLDVACPSVMGRERHEVYFERGAPFYVRLTGARYSAPLAADGKFTPVDARMTLVDGKITALWERTGVVASKRAIAARQAALDETLSWLAGPAAQLEWAPQRVGPPAVEAARARWQATMADLPRLTSSTRATAGCGARAVRLQWWSDAGGIRRVRLERGDREVREVFLDGGRPYFLFVETSAGRRVEEATRDYFDGGHLVWRLRWTGEADGPRGVQSDVTTDDDESARWTIEKVMRTTRGAGPYPCDDVGE